MKIGIARIYYGGGRRFFTLKAACRAEAKARIKARAIKRLGFFLDDGDEYPTAFIARVARLLERAHRRTTP
ncbi:hypothetical protein [Comamonas serinivorans]|uniref:hypothetical protein n=1 Tax=Comamonas serinivorans TaxID=1082851 RepID=UPI0012FA10FE|nr:hypothetical protein [Comamonas serinivorans]